MGYNERYWKNKDERAQEARAHTFKMEENYKSSINESVQKTKIYTPQIINTSAIKDPYVTPEVLVTDEDSVSAIFNHYNGKTCVLNFASYKNPGGMFLEGSQAQEECLCYESVLYNVLREQKEYYEYNNSNLNRALYTDRALYSPNVLFIKNGKKQICDVITCAAPNFSAFSKYSNLSEEKTKEENSRVFRQRIEFIKNILEENRVRTVILGAFGCGVFRQNAKEVSSIFKDVFAKTTVRKIIYAVPKGVDNNNYNDFKDTFQSR